MVAYVFVTTLVRDDQVNVSIELVPLIWNAAPWALAKIDSIGGWVLSNDIEELAILVKSFKNPAKNDP